MKHPPSSHQDDHAFVPHDHGRCIDAALAEASRICARQKGRLTEQRKRVLELVWSSHEPVGAYAILEQLRAEGFNGAPPTVYRALDFLLQQGLIHRLESLNAYTGCSHPGQGHNSQFLICHRCQRVAEMAAPEVSRAVTQAAGRLGFDCQQQVIEVRGLCPQCRDDSHES